MFYYEKNLDHGSEVAERLILNYKKIFGPTKKLYTTVLCKSLAPFLLLIFFEWEGRASNGGIVTMRQ
jgi:hypothetical protein